MQSPRSIGPLEEYGQDVWKAKKIIDERVRKVGTKIVTEYLIMWDGFDHSDNTWEPSENLLDEQLLDDWRNEPSEQKKCKPLSVEMALLGYSNDHNYAKKKTILEEVKVKVKASTSKRKQSTNSASRGDASSKPISVNKKNKTASFIYFGKTN